MRIKNEKENVFIDKRRGEKMINIADCYLFICVEKINQLNG